MDERQRRLLRSCLDLDGPVEPTSDDLGDWVHEANQQRVMPLLFHIVISGSSATTAVVESRAQAVQLEIMATIVRFEHDLLAITAELEKVGIPYAVLKGLATAHLDYEQPELRGCGDIDLLVSPLDLDRAIDLLARLGWEQAYALPRNHREFTHAVTLRNERRAEVDLHQRIAHRAVGRLVPTTELLENVRGYTIAGRDLWALSDIDRVIHAALHDRLSRGRYAHLSSTADVLVLTRHHAALAEAVAKRSDRWRVRSLVAAAIRSAYAAAGEPVPVSWQEAFAKPAAGRSILVNRAYLGPKRRPLTEEAAHLQTLPGWSERSRYVSGYFATDPDYAAQNKRPGMWAQTRYLLSRLRPGAE